MSKQEFIICQLHILEEKLIISFLTPPKTALAPYLKKPD
jgi:hypothetical protein